MKTQIKHRMLAGALLLLATGSMRPCAAQELSMLRQNLGMAGQSATPILAGRTYVVQQSIGQESVIGNFQANDLELRQGFIQPLNGPRAVGSSAPLNVEVFPNPFSEGFTVHCDDLADAQAMLRVFDLSGRVVHEQALLAMMQQQVLVPTIRTGTYVLRIQLDQRSFTAKLHKQ